MFYEIHPLGKIGYKKLTLADLGLVKSSHQTHIGLHESSVDYLRSFERHYLSTFIYEESYEDMLCLLDVIERKDGTIEAPYIRSGEQKELTFGGQMYQSVVKGIRSIVKNGTARNWYLFWFGLANEDLVFFLVDDNSGDFKKITTILGSLKAHGVIEHHHPSYNQIIYLLEEKINNVKRLYLEKLEIYAQSGELPITLPLIRPFDLERAKTIIKAIGRKGEELISDYLGRVLSQNKIRSFEWKDRSRESGLPFDFEVSTSSRGLFYVDVKSTSFSFKQEMIFSNHEIKFMIQQPQYQIFRVFNINENPAELRICSDSSLFAKTLGMTIDDSEQSFRRHNSKIRSINIGASPLHKGFVFDKKIIKLNYN